MIIKDNLPTFANVPIGVVDTITYKDMAHTNIFIQIILLKLNP